MYILCVSTTPLFHYLKIPLIRHFMLAMGTAAPATKKVMTGIMSSKKPLGLLPGGSEEILIAEAGKERVYIKKRKVRFTSTTTFSRAGHGYGRGEANQ